MRRGMLKMLDNLYHSDPDEYRCFIKDQMENIASIKEGGEDVIWLTPREGFVIETHFTKNNLDHVTGNKKMFINVCQHKAIDIPLDLKANIVHENAQQLYNLDIPLVISPKIRDFKDKCGNIDHTVDVLFNPWCIQKSVSNINFRSDLVKLSVNSVQEDLNIVLDCWKVIKSSYKGGVKCTNPYPFPITLPNNKKDNDREAKDNSIISDTNSLLSAIVASKNTANETGSIKFEKDNSKAAIKLVLIEEVDSNSNSTEKDKSVFQDFKPVDKNKNELTIPSRPSSIKANESIYGIDEVDEEFNSIINQIDPDFASCFTGIDDNECTMEEDGEFDFLSASAMLRQMKN